MTPKQFNQVKPPEIISKVVSEAGTSMNNFKQIADFNGSVGKALAERLAKASNGEMTELEILYPERFQDSA